MLKFPMGLFMKRRNIEIMESELQNRLRNKMLAAAGSFTELAKAFEGYIHKKDAFSEKERERLFSQITENVCRNCDRQRECWDFYEPECEEAIRGVLFQVEENGYLTQQQLPDFLVLHCVNLDGMLDEISRGFWVENTEIFWHNRVMEGKEAMVCQLGELAEYVSRTSTELFSGIVTEQRQEEALIRMLKRFHVRTENLVLQSRQDLGLELSLTARCAPGMRISVPMLAYGISHVLQTEMVPEEDAPAVLTDVPELLHFTADTCFTVQTGAAMALRDGQEVSGDTFSFFYPSAGEVMMILSDGMGSGAEASKESRDTVLLLKRLFDAGFGERSALQLTNSVLSLRKERNMFSTVDLCSINLFTGLCSFTKIGASVTVVFKEGEAELIRAETLPAGMLLSLDTDRFVRRLGGGDMVIMMSDGISDCLVQETEEEFLSFIIEMIRETSPQQSANRLLREAMRRNDFVPADDMTVLVCRLVNKASK